MMHDMTTTEARSALGRYGEDTGRTAAGRGRHDGPGSATGAAAGPARSTSWRRDGDALVVCEVKTRRAGHFEHPMAAVTPAKADRLRRLAERWLQEHGGAPPGGVRIDLVGVVLPGRGAPVVEHARGVA